MPLTIPPGWGIIIGIYEISRLKRPVALAKKPWAGEGADCKMMKKRRLAAGLLAVVLAVLAPMGVSAQGDVGEAIYEARVQSALERLQDMPGADLPEDPVVFDEGPQQEALPGEDGLSD